MKKDKEIIAMCDYSEDELSDRLKFLLEKEEWDGRELKWMMAYLEQTDGAALLKLLYQYFVASDSSEDPCDFDAVAILELINKRLFG